MKAAGHSALDLDCCFVFSLLAIHDSRDVAASIGDLPSVAHCVPPHSAFDISTVAQTAVLIWHCRSRNLQSERTLFTVSFFLCVFHNWCCQTVYKLTSTLCCCQTSKQQDQQGKQRVEAHGVVCSYSSGKEINVYHSNQSYRSGQPSFDYGYFLTRTKEKVSLFVSCCFGRSIQPCTIRSTIKSVTFSGLKHSTVNGRMSESLHFKPLAINQMYILSGNFYLLWP